MKRPLMLVCIVIMIICVLKFHICKTESPPEWVSTTTITLQGRVDSWEVRYNQSILYLSDVFFYGDSAEEISNNNSIGIICYCKGIQNVKLGQQIAVQGFLALPESAGNYGGFDTAAYYAVKGYDYILNDSVIIAEGETWDVILQGLYQFEQYAKKQLDDYLEPGDEGIMTAMLLGNKSSIESDVKELYRTVGIYHILAISGLHISMIGGCIYKFLKLLRLPPWLAVISSIVIIVLYGIMIGMPPSAFRAIVMFGFGLVAPLLNRSHDKLTSLAVAAACLICWEPVLIRDAGFQLSFLAVLGIVCLYPTFLSLHEHHMRFLDSMWVSFAVTYFTLPVIMQAYYEVPVYSLLVNFCILPFVPLLLGFGLLIVLGGEICSMVAEVSAWVIHRILFFYEKVLEFFAGLPGGTYVTGAPETFRVFVFYIVMAGLIYIMYRMKRRLLLCSLRSENAYAQGRQDEYVREQKAIRKRMRYVRLMQVIIMVLLVIFLLLPNKQIYRLTFLDVGQGDGICMEFKGDTYLVDCGSTSESRIGEYTLVPYLNYRGITEIEGWFLTHPDSDHVSAFTELCEDDDMGGVKVEIVYIPAVLEAEFAEIIAMAEMQEIEVIMLATGDVLEVNGVRLEILSPFEKGYYSDENAASLVFLMEYENFSGLFMGDAGLAAEEAVMEAGVENITLLKVAHHGSRIDTNTEEFIKTMSPEVAVISCGENNSYGHPHAEVMERLDNVGAVVLMTPEYGAVTIEFMHGMEVRSVKSPD